jgi:two-component sensor histidine kinase
VDVPTDMTIPLALIVNELVTNVVKHVGPPCGISSRSEIGNALRLTISDTGNGPPQDQPRLGLGTRMVGLLQATWRPRRNKAGVRGLHD